MTASCQVTDLSSSQNYTLKRTVEKKLQELDSVSDETLADYVMVLLANRHGREKVVNELEDFLGPMAVEGFVDWLFGYVEQIRNNTQMEATTYNNTVVSSVEGTKVVASREVGRTTVGRGRAFASAIKSITLNDLPAERDARMRDLSPVPASTRRERRRSRSPSMETQGDRRRRQRPSPARYRQENRLQASRSTFSTPSLSPPSSRRRIVKYQSLHTRELERQQGMSVFTSRTSEREALHPLDRKLNGKDKPSKDTVRDARELINRSMRQEKPIWRFHKPQHTMRMDSLESVDNATSTFESERPNNMPPGEEKKKRCTYWPNCKAGDSCPFVHPNEPCKHFPNCAFKDTCLFIHPAIPCKFQDRCQNPTCNYVHSSPAQLASTSPTDIITHGGQFTSMANPFQPPSAIACRFFPNCKNPQCPFLHPSTVMCKFGEQCQRPHCPFTHPLGRQVASRSFINAPCRYGKLCAKADCPFQHPSGKAVSSPNGSLPEEGDVFPIPLPNSENVEDSLPLPMASQ